MKRAATEAVTNLVYMPEVMERFKASDGALLRWWIALAGEDEDFPTARAAGGALAMISEDPEICELLLSGPPAEKAKDGDRLGSLPKLLTLLEEWDEPEMLHRICAVLQNVVDSAMPLGSGLAALARSNAAEVLGKLDLEEEDAAAAPAREAVQKLLAQLSSSSSSEKTAA